MTPPSKMAYKEFNAHIGAARLNPLGWAILAGTRDRAAIRVKVLCEESPDLVWVQHPGSECALLGIVARDELTYFRAYEPRGIDAPR